MSSLRIFTTEGYQSYPPERDAREADEQVQGVIDQSCDFLFDAERNRVIAYVRAVGVVRGGRPDHFYAVYDADSGEVAWDGLVAGLAALEAAEPEAEDETAVTPPEKDWTFVDDRVRFLIPWYLADNEALSLGATGLGTTDQLAVEELISTGEPLDISVDGHETAARLALCAREINPQLSFAITKYGRSEETKPAQLVLDPDGSRTFQPTNSTTAERISQARQNQVSTVRDWFVNEIDTHLETLATDPSAASVWDRYQDLNTLQRAVTTDGEPSNDLDFATGAGSSCVQLIRAVHRGVTVNDRYDPTLLDESALASLHADITDRVQSAFTRINDNGQEQILERLEGLIDEAETLETDERYSILSSMYRVLLSYSISTHETAPLIGRLTEELSEIEKTQLLSEARKKNIRRTFRDRVAEAKEATKVDRKAELEASLRAAIDSIGSQDEAEQFQKLTEVADLLESPHTETPDDVSASFQGIIAARDEITEDNILDEDEKTQLIRGIRTEVEDDIATVRETKYEDYLENASREISDLRRDIGPTQREYDALVSVQRIFDPENTSPNLIENPGRLRRLYNQIQSDDILSNRQVEELLENVGKMIEADLENIRFQRQSDLAESFDEALEEVVSGNDQYTPTERAQHLNCLEEYLRNSTTTLREFPTHGSYQTLASCARATKRGSAKGSQPLTQEQLEELQETFALSASQAYGSVVDDYQKHIESTFREHLSALVDDSPFDIAQKTLAIQLVLSPLGVEVPISHWNEEQLKHSVPDIENIQSHCTPLKEIVNDVRPDGGSPILSASERKETRSVLRKRINQSHTRLQESLASSIEESVSTAVETQCLAPIRGDSDDVPQQDVRQALSHIVELIDEIHTFREESSPPPVEITIGPENIHGLGLLTQTRRDRVIDELVQDLNREKADLKIRLSPKAKNDIEDSINKVADRQLFEAALRGLRAIEQLLNSNETTFTTTLEDHQVISRQVPDLTPQETQSLLELITTHRAEIISEFQDELRQQVDEELNIAMASDGKDINQQLGRLSDYIESGQGSFKRDGLQNIKSDIERIQGLERQGILTEEEAEKLFETLRGQIEERRGTGTSSSVIGGFLPDSRPAIVILVMGAGLVVVGLVLAILAITGTLDSVTGALPL